jgi:hypothetical protein
MSEMLSSGGLLRATSFERSPRVLFCWVAEAADPNSPDIFGKERDLCKG